MCVYICVDGWWFCGFIEMLVNDFLPTFLFGFFVWSIAGGRRRGGWLGCWRIAGARIGGGARGAWAGGWRTAGAMGAEMAQRGAGGSKNSAANLYSTMYHTEILGKKIYMLFLEFGGEAAKKWYIAVDLGFCFH